MQREMFTRPAATYWPRGVHRFMSTSDDGSGRARNAKDSTGSSYTCSRNAQKSSPAIAIFRLEP